MPRFKLTRHPSLGEKLLLAGALSLTACATAPGHALTATDAVIPYGEAAGPVKTAVGAGLPLTRIEDYLRSKAYDLRSTRPGVWRLSVEGVLVLLVAEDARIRILAPVFALHQLDGEPAIKQAIMVRLLQSNFERAADARYAVFDGIVFATVTHPRASLQEADLDLFLMQVVNLHKNTFRTGRRGYSSAPPEPGSTEVDPRLDESLLTPEAFEGGRSSGSSPRPDATASERVVL